MMIRFVWKPDYHAIQYLGAKAIITGVRNGRRAARTKTFTRKGLALA